jgi:hypothetical protein
MFGAFDSNTPTGRGEIVLPATELPNLFDDDSEISEPTQSKRGLAVALYARTARNTGESASTPLDQTGRTIAGKSRVLKNRLRSSK